MLYVGSLLAPVAGDNVKLNVPALLQGSVAISLNSREVYEQILSTLSLNEAVALFSIKLLYFTSHFSPP